MQVNVRGTGLDVGVVVHLAFRLIQFCTLVLPGLFLHPSFAWHARPFPTSTICMACPTLSYIHHLHGMSDPFLDLSVACGRTACQGQTTTFACMYLQCHAMIISSSCVFRYQMGPIVFTACLEEVTCSL